VARDDEARADAIREAAIRVLLETRREYLAAGANALKHWEQLYDRLVLALRTSSTAEQFVSAFRRGLHLGAPSVEAARAAVALAEAMDADAASWIALLEEEVGYLVAAARKAAEERKEAAVERRADAATRSEQGLFCGAADE